MVQRKSKISTLFEFVTQTNKHFQCFLPVPTDQVTVWSYVGSLKKYMIPRKERLKDQKQNYSQRNHGKNQQSLVSLLVSLLAGSDQKDLRRKRRHLFLGKLLNFLWRDLTVSLCTDWSKPSFPCVTPPAPVWQTVISLKTWKKTFHFPASVMSQPTSTNQELELQLKKSVRSPAASSSSSSVVGSSGKNLRHFLNN